MLKTKKYVMFLKSIAVLFLLVITGIWLGLHYESVPTNDAIPSGHSKKISVAILETGGSHDEVTMALYHAIGRVSGTNTTLHLAKTRYGSETIYAWMHREYKLSPYSISDPSHFRPSDMPMPAMIVLVTCRMDSKYAETTLDFYFNNGPLDQILLCVMHHSDWEFKDLEPRVRQWAKAGRLRLITLSGHTGLNLRKEVEKFDHVYKEVSIDVLPPVYPVPLDDTPPSNSGNISISVQGNLEDRRRDYRKMFHDFERLIDQLPQTIVSRLQLFVVGSGKPVEISDRIMPYVSFQLNLDYIPYYRLLHSSFVLIPAFADEGYYITKASSSVPASFIANTPIVGSQRLLNTYTYLSSDSMWHLKWEEESEMDAIYEILKEHFDENGAEKKSWKSAVEAKRRAVNDRGIEVMEENARLMQDIVLNLSIMEERNAV